MNFDSDEAEKKTKRTANKQSSNKSEYSDDIEVEEEG